MKNFAKLVALSLDRCHLDTKVLADCARKGQITPRSYEAFAAKIHEDVMLPKKSAPRSARLTSARIS